MEAHICLCTRKGDTRKVLLQMSTKSVFLKPIYLPDTVLEFKFSPKYESEFRYFFNSRSYQLRSQKYSKYIRSFLTLENSGLLI